MTSSVYGAASDPAVIQRKEASGAAPAAAPSAAPAIGSGQPLPGGFRAEMESFLGIDLAAVRVHEGGQAGAAGAIAYAKGTDIFMAPGTYDPTSPEGRELLGHELAHVAQQARGQVKATGDVAGHALNSDASLEREADAVGAQAARGGARAPARGTVAPAPASTPVASPSAPIQRKAESLSGDPAERKDAAGNNRTTHRSPVLGDATEGPAVPAAASEATTANVRVIAGEASKLHIEPAATPEASRVYEETRRAESPAPAGFTTVTAFNGTIAAPQVAQEASKAIYINEQPTAGDVQQAGIGDCFFLAAVMSVVSRDPAKIKSIVTPDGNGGATVTLWRAQMKPPSILDRIRGKGPQREWIPVSVSVDDKLAFNVGPNGRLHGAQLRVAEKPRSADYWAKLAGANLEVHRKDVHDCARWAPLLEKAYARFAQTHGNYGGTRDGGRTAPSGYDAIHGGWTHNMLPVLYGPEADDPGSQLHQQAITWAPGTANPVLANTAIMDQLVLLQGKGSEAQPGDTQAPILTATASVDPLITRLSAAIGAATTDPDWVNLDAAKQADVQAVTTAINARNAMPPDTVVNGPKFQARQPIGNACQVAVRPGIDESAVGTDANNRFKVWTKDPVYFEQGQDALQPDDATRLAGFNNNLSIFKLPQVKVKIDGHASKEGTPADNQALSLRRATAVQNAVSGSPANIAPHTTEAHAHGASGAHWNDPKDRRVDLAFETSDRRINPLLDPMRSAPIRSMADLMLDLRNIGTDRSMGQRNIYGDHVYSIVSVDIVDAAGAPVNLAGTPAASRGPLYAQVDANASTVRVRNPHHGNEPDRTNSNRPTHAGDGPSAGAGADGIFTMTLSEFFRNFTTVESGVFKRS